MTIVIFLLLYHVRHCPWEPRALGAQATNEAFTCQATTLLLKITNLDQASRFIFASDSMIVSLDDIVIGSCRVYCLRTVLLLISGAICTISPPPRPKRSIYAPAHAFNGYHGPRNERMRHPESPDQECILPSPSLRFWRSAKLCSTTWQRLRSISSDEPHKVSSEDSR